MDTALLIALAIAALVVFGVLLRVARPWKRRGGTAETHETPHLVTQNLDFSILGQRPEIISEEEEPESASDGGRTE